MAFSDFQKRRLRLALRFYHRYKTDIDGRSLSWEFIAHDIEDITGVKIPPERVRQFAIGYWRKGKYVYSEPEGSGLKAIADFAVHPDRNLLPPDELEELQPDYRAPMYMLEYLKPVYDSEPLEAPKSLTGIYSTQYTSGDDLVISELTLQGVSKDGAIRATQIIDIYPADIADDFTNIPPLDLRNVRRKRRDAGGWAILSPEENLLFFLKEKQWQTNLYYISLLEMDLWSSDQVSELTLLHHDYPYEYDIGKLTKDEGNNSRGQLFDYLSDSMMSNVIQYSRVE